MSNLNLNKNKEFTNLGGISPIYFIPISEISSLDDIIKGVINKINYNDAEFTPYYIDIIQEKGKFKEDQVSRTRFNYKISVKYSKDELSTRNTLEQIDSKKLVVLVPDANGNYRVIGSKENPVFISSELDKGTSTSDLNAYDLIINWSTKYRAPFIAVSEEFIPSDENCSAPPPLLPQKLDWFKDTIADIRIMKTHYHGDDIGCYANRYIYQYNSTSTDADNGTTILKPDDVLGTGRWLKMLEIDNPNFNKYDCTVGIGNTYDYKDPSVAILAGKRKLLIMNEVTWSNNIGSISDYIYISANNLTKINFSILANNSSPKIFWKNINLTLTGTTKIFNSGEFYMYNCSITGNNENNYFSQYYVYLNGDNITINVGSAGQLKLQIKNVNNLIIDIGAGQNSNISTYGGIINSLTFKGVGYGNILSRQVLYLNSSQVNKIINSLTGTGYANIKVVNATIYDAENISIYDNSNFYIKNSSIYQILGATGHDISLENCTLNSMYYGKFQALNIKQFENIVYTGNLEIDTTAKIINCTFGGNILISGDNVTLQNPIVENETITVNAEADKCVIINPRTQTPIIDNNPTSTKIIAPNLI